MYMIIVIYDRVQRETGHKCTHSCYIYIVSFLLFVQIRKFDFIGPYGEKM